MSSKAAHASYMHVWAIASARATIGGPLRSDLLRRTSARADVFQSLTKVAEADVAHPSTATKAVTRSARFTRNFGIAAPAMIRESIISALLRTHRRTVHEQAIRPIPRPNPSALVGQEPYQAGKIRAAQRIRDSTRDTRPLQLDRMAPGVAPLANPPLRTTNLIETFR